MKQFHKNLVAGNNAEAGTGPVNNVRINETAAKAGSGENENRGHAMASKAKETGSD